MGLLGHLYEIGNRLEGVLGSGYVLSFCVLALPSLLCNMFSYRRPTAIGTIRLGAPKLQSEITF